MTSLRVASFNIRNGRAVDGWNSWPFRAAATAAAIAGLGADVVGLQEAYAFQLRSLCRRLGRYDAVGDARTDGRHGERTPVLFDDRGMAVVDAVTRWYGDRPDQPGTVLEGAGFPRITTICRLRLADGVVVQVANTHLDERSGDRRAASLGQLAGWLDVSAPRIVLGDLNADPHDTVLDALREVGLRDALDGVAGGTSHSFTGRGDGRRIDHIFVSEDVEVLESHVEQARPGGRLPSDHWPVVADLRILSA